MEPDGPASGREMFLEPFAGAEFPGSAGAATRLMQICFLVGGNGGEMFFLVGENGGEMFLVGKNGGEMFFGGGKRG